jgi:ferredoxin-fold anticodon binding domain-containing protein
MEEYIKRKEGELNEGEEGNNKVLKYKFENMKKLSEGEIDKFEE